MLFYNFPVTDHPVFQYSFYNLCFILFPIELLPVHIPKQMRRKIRYAYWFVQFPFLFFRMMNAELLIINSQLAESSGLNDLQQILPITAFLQFIGQLQHFFFINKSVAVGNFFDTANIGTLPFFNNTDKFSSIVQ